MRVYLAPCGIGLGHITRTMPIANELSHRGFETVFSTYLDGLDYAKRNNLRTYEAIPISFKVTGDGSIDFKMTAATSGFSLGIRRFLRQVVHEIQYLKFFRPDVVFSDSRASSLIAARLLRIPVALMLNQFRVEIIRRPSNRKLSLFDRLFFFIANIGWLFIRTVIQLVWGRSEVILIPDLPPPFTICQGNLAIPRRYGKKVKLIGPILENGPDVDPDQSHVKKRLGLDSEKPLIYAAVSGPRVERGILSQILLDSLTAISDGYSVVISRGDPNGEPTPRAVKRMIIYDWIENQEDYIQASDVVVSRAGHGTIMKSLMYGKPLVLIPIPDHTEQYSNARRAAVLHVAQIIDQNQVTSEKLRLTIQEVLTGESYRINALSIREAAASMHAVSAACDIISSLAKRS